MKSIDYLVPNEYMQNGYTHLNQYVPASYVQTLEEYARTGCDVGGFLTACLENDLCKAVGKADGQNIDRLAAICCFLYNELPNGCWGSPAAVLRHKKKHSAAKRSVDNAFQQVLG